MMNPWWIIGIIAFVLAAGIFIVSEIEIRRARRRSKNIKEDAVTVSTDITVPDPPDFQSVAEIHSFYEELKVRDPVRAGKAMYEAQLKIHDRS